MWIQLGLVTVMLAGCIVPDIDSGSGSFDLLDRQVYLDDDGAQLSVVGCVTGIVGPCDASGAMMVTVDGVVYDVPAVTVPPKPAAVLDTGDVEYRRTVPAPAEPYVEVMLEGQGARVHVPPAFPVGPPPNPVSRAMGTLSLSFLPLFGATGDADETITCGSDTYHVPDFEVTEPGQVSLVLGDGFLTGTCDYVVHVHQRVPLPADAWLGGSVARTATVTFQSVP